MRTLRLVTIALVFTALPAFADLFTNFSVGGEAYNVADQINFFGGCGASGTSSASCGFSDSTGTLAGTFEGTANYGSVAGGGSIPTPLVGGFDLFSGFSFGLDTGFNDALTIYANGGSGYLALVIPFAIDCPSDSSCEPGNLSVTVGNETTNSPAGACPEDGGCSDNFGPGITPGPLTLLFPVEFNETVPFDLALTYPADFIADNEFFDMSVSYSANIGSVTILDSNLNQLSGFQYRTESHSPYPINGGILVPEPSTLLLLATAGLALLLARTPRSAKVSRKTL